MKIIFLYKNESCNRWYNARLEAWIVKDAYSNPLNKEVKAFNRLEEINIFISKGTNYECKKIDQHFRFEGGKDDCMGHQATTQKEFLKSMCEGSASWNSYTVIEKKLYERLRAAIIKITDRHKYIDFDQFKGEQKERITILF